MRLESPDQINLIWIPIEVGYSYGFKKILKTSIDHQITASTDHEDIHSSLNRGEDLSMKDKNQIFIFA